MPTLIELFDQHRNQLTNRISEDQSPENVVRETKRFLDFLGMNYIEQVEYTPIQRRLAPFIIDVLKASVSTLIAASQTSIWRRESPSSSPPVSRHRRSIMSQTVWWRGGQALIILLLVAQLWGSGEILAFLLLILLVGSEMTLIWPIKRLHLPWLKNRTSSPEPPSLQVSVQIDISIFLTKFADTLLTVDKVLAETLVLKATPTVTGKGLEDYHSVIELLQDLLEAKNAADSTFALKKAKTIPAILEQYGLTMELFNGENHHFFEFLPHLDSNATDYQTLSPALVKNKRLICRGRVLEPN